MKKATLVLFLVILNHQLSFAQESIKKQIPTLENKKVAVVTDYVEPIKTKENPKEEVGQINWTKKYIAAEGVVFLNPKHIQEMGIEYAQTLAKEGAETIARRNLMRTINRVRIVDSVFVEDSMLKRNITIQTMEGFIKAYKVGDYDVNDKRVKVILRCDLEGDVGSVESFVKDKLLANNESISPLSSTKKLQQEDKEILQSVGINPDSIPKVDVIIPKENQETIKPSLFLSRIRVVDNSGETIWTNYIGGIKTKDEKVNATINTSIEILKATGGLESIMKSAKLKLDADGTVVLNIQDVISADQYKNSIKGGKLNKIIPIIVSILPLVLKFVK